MKNGLTKSIIAVGVFGIFSLAAHAQSSVTLYGSLDAGIVYVNNVGGNSLWAQSSGLIANSYFGLSGAEDIGGGTKAIFKLESGFNLNNGALSQGNFLSDSQGLFGRQAYVGLKNDQYGTITLGRQYDSIADYLTPLALAGQAGGVNLAAHPFNNDNIGAEYSYSNAVKYQSANYAGFQFGGMYSFSNGTTFAEGRQWSLGAGYNRGPFKLAAAYSQMNGSGGSNAAATAIDIPTFGNQTASLVTAGNTQRTLGVGGNYSYGPGTAGLLWTHTHIQEVGGVENVNMRFDNIEANGTYSITPALVLVGNYTYTWSKFNCPGTGCGDHPDWHSATLAADYSLSKRTDMYLAAVYQHASSEKSGGVFFYYPTSIAGIIPSSTSQNQVAVTVGMRHRF